MEYQYSPWFLGRVIGDTSLTQQQYFEMNYPQPSFTPDYKTDSRLMARGEGQRNNNVLPQVPDMQDMESAMTNGSAGTLPALQDTSRLWQPD